MKTDKKLQQPPINTIKDLLDKIESSKLSSGEKDLQKQIALLAYEIGKREMKDKIMEAFNKVQEQKSDPDTQYETEYVDTKFRGISKIEY